MTGIEDRSTMHFRSEFEERSPIAMQKNPGRSSQELPPVPHNVALSFRPIRSHWHLGNTKISIVRRTSNHIGGNPGELV